MKLPNLSTNYPAIILRVVMGVIFITHGAARLYHGSIPNFGGFLESQGFPFGVLFAGAVTMGELVSGSMLAIGYKVRYCVLFHTVVIITGIVLIHLPNGWFVVGHGSNGVEFSVLILAVLLFLYSKN